MVDEALEAAERLAERGISVEVIDPRTIAPLDMETILNSLRKTMRLAIAHEAHRTCGFGAEIAARCMEVAFDYLDAPVERVAASTCRSPAPERPRGLPRADDIVAAVERLVRDDARVIGYVPQLSMAMEEAKVGRWLVEDGAAVTAGQGVVEIETDKATHEVEAPSGRRGPDRGRSGRDRRGRRSARRARARWRRGGGRGATDDAGTPPAVDAARSAPIVAAPQAAGPIASPAARRVAREHGIELATWRARGPAGGSWRATSGGRGR